VIVGAGTLRSVPQHRWSARYIFPPLAEEYQRLRSSLGKPAPPLNVIVKAQGEVGLDLPVFQSGEVHVLIVTTPQGARRISRQAVPSAVEVATVQTDGKISVQAILEAVGRIRQSEVILVEVARN
jgi:riboflavin biosynthesis pyrimidine reductase